MTPDRMIAALAPVLDRVRRSDHWVVPPGGSPSHRRQKLTDAVLLNHVLGVTRIGACPMEQGSDTTRLGLLDLDSHRGEVKWSQMQDVAMRLMQTAELLGFNLIPFRSSGGRGIHLLALWELPQDARSVRSAMADVIRINGMKPGAHKTGVAGGYVEQFPKQDEVPVDGWGNMHLLPMAGKSVPLSPVDLSEIHLLDVKWPDSDPVPVLPKPERSTALVVAVPPELQKVRSALFAIDPNTLGYDEWVRLLFAVHHATNAGADGLAMFLEWSQQWSGYDPVTSEAETRKQYSFAKIKEGGITAQTLFRTAEGAGWEDPDRLSGFEVITDPMPSQVTDLLAPAEGEQVQVVGKGGPLVNVSNVTKVLGRSAAVRVRLDAFRCEDAIDWEGTGMFHPLNDADLVELRCRLEEGAGFRNVGSDLIRSAVLRIAHRNVIDTAIEWITRLPAWDGKPRIGRFLPTYLGAVDNDYTRAVSRYMWTAMAGRVLEPGAQADMVPVYVGEQGIGKSQSIKAMLPTGTEEDEFYAEIDLGKRDVDQARLLRGKLIGEIAELRGLASRDHESIKAWITRTHEEWTQKYMEKNTRYARRCIFIGTTNKEQFLADETGERRWLPVRVIRADRAGIVRDRDQLWAEARDTFLLDGIAYSEAERLAKMQHGDFTVDDPWLEPISDYVAEVGSRPFTLQEVFAVALRMEIRYTQTREGNRLGALLHRLGCVRYNGRHPETKRSARMWRAPAGPRAADLL